MASSARPGSDLARFGLGPLARAGTTARAESLAGVGNRLRRLRTARGLTLAGVGALTGLSTSTLSRLEQGQRRPTLELLLDLSHVYEIALDDLVAAPEEGDLHIRLKPRRAKGRTVIPLTQHPGGIQAWKIVIPPGASRPRPRGHPGSEWLIVLSGHLRLLVGTGESTLTAGEVASFDTTIPHWFGSADGQVVEILSLFARPGVVMTAALP